MEKREQKEIFKIISKSKTDGVFGVLDVDSGIRGPKVGVLCMTHGNEPCGLSAAKFILNNLKLKKGSVRIILQNIKAGENYFLNKKSKTNNRFIDVNLNRLPKLGNKDGRYEIKRATELKRAYSECDVLVDLHSTSQKSDPMCIAFKDTPKDIIKNISVSTVIMGIEQVQKGIPAMYIGPKNAKKIAFECGSHEQKSSFNRAKKYTHELLSHLGMVDKIISKKQKQNYFKVESSLILNKGFSLVKKFKNFEKIKKGDVLAKNSKKEIIVLDRDYYSLFCKQDFKKNIIGEEALFLCTKL